MFSHCKCAEVNEIGFATIDWLTRVFRQWCRSHQTIAHARTFQIKFSQIKVPVINRLLYTMYTAFYTMSTQSYKLCHFNLTISILLGKTENSTKTADCLLQALKADVCNFRSVLIFLSFFHCLLKNSSQSSDRKSFTFSQSFYQKIYPQTKYV